MPEDPNFGDIDDAQLEAAMAALLKSSSGSRSAPSSARSAGHVNGNGHLSTDPVDSPTAMALEPDYQWAAEPPPVHDLDLDSDLDLGPALENGQDLEVSPWSPAAFDDSAAADLALVESSFGGPLHSALADLRDLNSETFTSPPPPEEPPLAPSSLPPPNFARPWKMRGPRLPQLFTAGGSWSNRKRELVPALVVACLVVLGLAAVVTTMTRDDGSNSNVRVSTPTSVVPTTISLDTIPPAPGPLPVDSVPATVVAPTSGSGATGLRAPVRRAAAPKSGSSPAPAATPAPASPATPADTGPTPPSSDSVVSPPTTSPPVTTPTTTPSTTSPPTTQPPHDLCSAITDPVQLDRCLHPRG